MLTGYECTAVLVVPKRRRAARLIVNKAIRPRPGRITIKDVAAAAGVSTATVSNVANGTGKFSRATKERVKAAILSTKWKANMHARNLARTAE